MSSIRLASREIVDVVYRAGRLKGLSGGEAEAYARSTCFAAGQLGQSLEVAANRLSSHQPGCGMSVVAQAEMERGRQRTPTGDWTIGELAFAAWGALSRGTEISFVVAQRRLDLAAWLRTPDPDQRVVGVVADSLGTRGLTELELVEGRYREVLRDGITVEERHWERLCAQAAPYLIPESVIDESC